MADLSGVLRKTIDGLPRATPQMRAKVYEKARSAIQRQIQAANPPLAPEIAEARMRALEDAIERTEQHYLSAEAPDAQAAEVEEPVAATPTPAPGPVPEPAPAPEPEPAAAGPESGMRSPDDARDDTHDHTPAADGWNEPGRRAPADETAYEGEGDAAEPGPASLPPAAGHSAWNNEAPPARPVPAEEEAPADDWRASGQGASEDADDRDPYAPGAGAGAAAGTAAAFMRDDRHPDERSEGRDEPDLEYQRDARLPEEAVTIPAADVSAPRYTPPRRPAARNRNNKAGLAVASLIVIVGALGAVAYFYGEDISNSLLGEDPLIAATEPGADAGSQPTGVATSGEGADAETNAADTGAETDAPVDTGGSTRRFTQRLLPDGTEIDEGPAIPEPNAFGEGTDVATATPVEETVTPGTSPTVSAEIGEEPQIVGGETSPGESEAPAEVAADENAGETGSETQGVAEPEAGESTVAGDDGAIPVAQRAVFYQERTADTPGTQETGTVVWSVVEEPPIEGQPPEPAIRAVAEVPDENVTMTMTIRRNADPTLPASHVIELLFETPSGFSGGNVATVQRLALKPTEQARGEPLIGVAGKISDGFFIVALNNLEQAVQNNLSLLESEEWIDIPIGYATGRRALVSIEKGIPGDRAFKEAIAAWEAKT